MDKPASLPTPSATDSDVSDTESAREIADKLASINQRMELACCRSGRARSDVRLLPVTKTVEASRLRLAYQVGLTEFGENIVQEAMDKAQALDDLPVRWSIIGHLQTNKARYVARFAHELQSLDSLKLAEILDRRLQREQRYLDVLVQVNSTGEANKYGLPPEEVHSFMMSMTGFDCLRVRGMMTLALFSANAQRVRECFVRLRKLRERLLQSIPDPSMCHELSMGMSSDFEIAIEEGSTCVRVGQALFGPRALPDSYYWPDVES